MKEKFRDFFVIILILILLFVIYSKYIRKDKITTIFGYSFLIVLTGSMEPEIETGSLIIVKYEKKYNVRRYYYIYRR